MQNVHQSKQKLCLKFQKIRSERTIFNILKQNHENSQKISIFCDEKRRNFIFKRFFQTLKIKTFKKLEFLSKITPKSLYLFNFLFNLNQFDNQTNVISVDNFTQMFSPRKNLEFQTGLYSPIQEVVILIKILKLNIFFFLNFSF